MRTSPAIFILETRNPTKYKCLPKFVQTDDATIVSKRPNREIGGKKKFRSAYILGEKDPIDELMWKER